MVKNSKILVAGGSGFIGTNLISALISNDNEVISISKNACKIKKKVRNAKYFFHDLKKPINENLIKNLEGIEYVINCSGYINHNNFRNNGKEIFDDHFYSLISLANLAIDLKVKTFVHLGSSDEYGKNNSPIKESARESPQTPYALGKLTSTHFLQQCHKEGVLNTVILRPFLVYGYRQSKERFLPFLIDNCLNDREFKVSKGLQIRDYLYVKDFNIALIKALNNNDAYGEVINVASGIPISIKEVIDTVKEIIGKGKPIFGGVDYRTGESMELYANIEKAKKILKWEPKFEFRQSLREVINCYSKNN